MSNFIPTKLYTTASQKVEEEIEKELKIPDPPEGEAIAAIGATKCLCQQDIQKKKS